MAPLRISLLSASLILAAAATLGPSPAQASRTAKGSAPTARSHMGMANDAETGQVVLFGGWDGTQPLDDTWTWDGSSWTEQHPVRSPEPRCCFQMAYDAARGQVVLSGGTDLYTYYTDTWT